MFQGVDRRARDAICGAYCAAHHSALPEGLTVKYWLIGVTAALSLMAMAPERGAVGLAAGVSQGR
jgi:hypothetical protein